MNQPVSIRQNLQRNLTLIVLVLGTAILAMTFVGGRAAMRGFSQALIDQTSSRTVARLEAFFDPVDRQLEMLQEWGAAGRLDIEQPSDLQAVFAAFMHRHPWVTSCMLADESGREYLLLRTGNKWRSRQTLDPGRTNRVVWNRWSDDAPDPVTTEEVLEYDPRRRPWFVGAGFDTPYWTEPYTFFTTRDPGITASVAYTHDGRRYVLGLDLTLLDISRFTSTLRVSDGGAAFVLDGEGRVIGMPGTRTYADEDSLKRDLLQPPGALDTPAAHALAATLPAGGSGEGATRFRDDSGAWWGQLRAFDLAPDRRLYVGVAVPEADLVGDVVRQRVWIAIATAVVIGLAVLRARKIARQYSDPMERLAAQSERIAIGDLERREEISSGLQEVQRLARAHDEMRKGLTTLLKLEQDLRVARRIQMGALPDRLPALPGFDLAAWSEPAEETGGDSYDVIGVRHVSTAEKIVIDDETAGRAILLLADATGHGIGPALSVTQVRAMLRVAVRASLDLSEIATHINRQLCADLPSGHFVTAWLGEIEASSGKLRAVAAGQAPILHFHAATGRFDVKKSDTVPLGMADLGPVEVPGAVELQPGDLYAVISDGIFEAMNQAQEPFGVERVQDVIRSNAGARAQDILARIRDATDEFTAGLPADDDRTIVLIQRT